MDYRWLYRLLGAGMPMKPYSPTPFKSLPLQNEIMTITKTEIRPGAYYDSVVLMQLQRSLAALDGVDDAGVVMATPAT